MRILKKTTFNYLQPLLRLSIAFLWIFSGVISLLPINQATGLNLLSHASIPSSLRPFTLYSLSSMDIVLGIATLLNWQIFIVGFIECVAIIAYTIVISVFIPTYWLDPFTPIAKNIPLLIATLVMMTQGSEY